MADTTPATTWTPRSGEGEWVSSSSSDIADSSNNQLVDSSSNNLVDDSSAFNPVAATTWTENNGS